MQGCVATPAASFAPPRPTSAPPSSACLNPRRDTHYRAFLNGMCFLSRVDVSLAKHLHDSKNDNPPKIQKIRGQKHPALAAPRVNTEANLTMRSVSFQIKVPAPERPSDCRFRPQRRRYSRVSLCAQVPCRRQLEEPPTPISFFCSFQKPFLQAQKPLLVHDFDWTSHPFFENRNRFSLHIVEAKRHVANFGIIKQV